MAYIFKVAYKKGKKHLLKIDIGDGEAKWMDTDETVYNFVKQNFEDGDEIGIEYTQHGKLYKVIRVNKDGKNVEKSSKEDAPVKETKSPPISGDSDKPVYSDCGKELKDSKYKKCYTCNQANPEQGKYSQKSPEVQASIKAQTAYKCASIAMQVFTGQIADLDTLKSQLDDLANHIVNKF